MWEILPIIVFGWPAIIASLACSFVGVARGKPALAVAGAVLATPTAWYLTVASPRFWFLGPVFPLLALAAAYMVKKRRRDVAVLLLLPFAVYAVWLAVAVIRQ